MKIFNTTQGFCTVCKKVIEANIVEKNGAMFMQKRCPQHGDFEVKIAKHAWYYKGLISYWHNLYGQDFYKRKQLASYTCEATPKCNLACPICYAKSSGPEPEKISLEFFEEQLKKIKRKKIAIRLSGGECTEMENLPQIIRLISKYGHVPFLVTNGVRIANDLNYLKLLKEAGLKGISTWIDSVSNPEIYKRLRGGDFLALKKKAVENIKKLKIALRIPQILIKGYNESEIESLLSFARKDDAINTYWVQGYNHLGRCAFSLEQEFLQDEMVEIVAERSGGLFSLEDVYYFQKIVYAASVLRDEPYCYSIQVMFVPRNKEKSMRETFDFEKFSKVLDKFEEIWQTDKKRAKRYFLAKSLPKLLKNPALVHLFFKKRMAGPTFDSLPRAPHYLLVLMNATSTLPNLDFKLFRNQCRNCSFNLGVENNISRCQQIAEIFSPTKNL